MKRHLFFLSIPIFALFTVPVFASLTGGDYEIYADTFSFVSTAESTGGAYSLFESGGEFFATTTAGGDYAVRGGFLAEEKGILSVTLGASSVSLGTLSIGSVTSGANTVTVDTDNWNGYTLSIFDDGDLRAGSDTIDDVGDGSVTAGSEEYGVAVTGDDVVGAVAGQDIAITTSPTTIAQSTGQVTAALTTITHKAAMSGATIDGTYGHTVTYRVFVNP